MSAVEERYNFSAAFEKLPQSMTYMNACNKSFSIASSFVSTTGSYHCSFFLLPCQASGEYTSIAKNNPPHEMGDVTKLQASTKEEISFYGDSG